MRRVEDTSPDRVTGGHTYFSATLSKGHLGIHEAIGERVSKSNEVIH